MSLNIQQYLIKSGNYVLKNCTSKTFVFSKEFHTREMLESMNEKWKSQVIISSSIYQKINMNGFIEWHLWIKKLFTTEVVSKYRRLINEKKIEQRRQNFLNNYMTKNSSN